MVAIFPFPKEQCAFDPKDVSAMSTAFEEVCKALLRDQVSERLGTSIVSAPLACDGVLIPSHCTGNGEAPPMHRSCRGACKRSASRVARARIQRRWRQP